MSGGLKHAMLIGCCVIAAAGAMLLPGCKREQNNTVATAPNGTSRPSTSTAAGSPLRQPTSESLKYNLSDAIAVAESAIAGDHLFEWAQAVAFARSLDPTGTELADGLGTLISSGSPSEERLAVRFLKDVRDKDGPQWNKSISDELVRTAIDRANSIRQDEGMVRYRIAQLLATREEDRLSALEWLADTHARLEWYASRLAPNLRAKGVKERLATVRVLTKIAPSSHVAEKVLASALVDSDSVVRCAAANGIAEASSISSKTAEMLFAAMSDTARVRRAVVSTLIKFIDGHPQAVAAVVKAIWDQDPDVRQMGIEAFARPDVLSTVGVENLIAALRHPDHNVRRNAAYALQARKAESDSVLSALTTSVDRGNFIVREALADALERAQREKSTALAALKMTAEHGDSSSAQAYARAALREIEVKKDNSR